MVNQTLRILNIEDSERDVALLHRHLSRAGYELISDRVDTPAAMRVALESQEWDVILCDYSMPQFNALQALALLKEMKLDVPFIIISGTVGEDVAVQAMRAGAHDYLMKDNLMRLVPTIERELAEAENRRARHQAEESLKASESELRALFAAMSDVIIVLDAEGRHLKVAPSNPPHLYQAAVERIGKTLHDVFPKAKADLFLDYIHRALNKKRMHRLEYSLSIDGRDMWFEGSVSPMTEDSVIWIARNITARKQAEEEEARLNAHIETQRQRLNNIIANVPGIVWESAGEPDAPTQSLDFVSDYAETMLGYSVQEWLSTPNFWQAIVHPEDLEKTVREAALAFASGKSSRLEFRLLAKDGQEVWVESQSAIITNHEGVPVGTRGVTIDITERKALEEQLRQSQKLEAIGMLAGGIAHDFNNLLTAIIGYSELSLFQLRQEDPLQQYISEVKRAADRAAGLTRQLLAFSRKQVMQPKVLDLNTIISELEKMLHRVIGEDIELRAMLEPEVGSVKADPGQIEQVIMNLAVNARDAMPQGGKLTIETQNIYLNDEYARQHITVNPGHYVMLAVSDTGTGMDEKTQAHIFEPFFTTKRAGHGTGLGLSTVYGIVKQSGGNIWVYSELGQGTTFKVYLPRVDEGAQEHKPQAEAEEFNRGTETVLLAEDEEIVRKLAIQVLESYGYHVLEAANGGAALLICERYQEPIHLLLTDVIMPEMSGRLLADRLKLLRPEMKVLYMSGYTDNAIVHQGVLDDGANFIQKPFTPKALAQKVREVLEK
jgi:two-component system, cell cycle sensor histidine kinase and response regulator CckA